MDSQQPAGSTVRAAGAARRLLGGCCEVLCSQRPAQLAQHGTSSQQAALGSRGGAGQHQIVSQPDQGVSVLLYLRNHGKHVDRIDLSGISDRTVVPSFVPAARCNVIACLPCNTSFLYPTFPLSCSSAARRLRIWACSCCPVALCWGLRVRQRSHSSSSTHARWSAVRRPQHRQRRCRSGLMVWSTFSCNT